MTKFLLDTSTFSRAILKSPDQHILEHLREHGGSCAMASVTWHELRFGVGRLPRGKRQRELVEFLEEVVLPTIPTLSYDERAATWHADERVRLEKLGKTPPFIDGQIAAVAITNGLPVVTANPKDFKAFKGVTVLNWAST
jgi:tRNA(fMet)-specific endonuclease VapC